MRNLKFRESMVEDAKFIAASLRQADADELTACGHTDYEKAIAQSIAYSVASWTALIDDMPVAAFGVTPISILDGSGCPWFLAATAADRANISFLKIGRVYLREILDMFPILENTIDVRNKKSIRWLKRLGFKFDHPTPHPKTGYMFMRFAMEAHHV